jgi:DnaJ-class molecular chaperone
MMISRQMAEQAVRDLDIEPRLDLITEDVVQTAYRDSVKRYHPDKGGCMDDFVRVDRAKCLLLAWLQRPQAAPPDESISSEKCIACKGTGRRTLQRGFRSMTMVCGSCRGAGERLPPEKLEE